jgi:hypothetical protein
MNYEEEFLFDGATKKNSSAGCTYGGLLGHFSKKPFSVPLSHRSRLQVI